MGPQNHTRKDNVVTKTVSASLGMNFGKVLIEDADEARRQIVGPSLASIFDVKAHRTEDTISLLDTGAVTNLVSSRYWGNGARTEVYGSLCDIRQREGLSVRWLCGKD